jgi:hypothetical protein
MFSMVFSIVVCTAVSLAILYVAFMAICCVVAIVSQACSKKKTPQQVQDEIVKRFHS